MFFTALGFSSIASYFDLKTGEIPDKFTVGLIVAALAMRAVLSPLIGDFTYLFDGMVVGAIFFAFGALLFYTGGWGGGDAKLIAGIGAALGGFLYPSIIANTGLFPEFFGIFISLSIVAIPYSLIYAFILSLRKPEVFSLCKKRIVKNWMVLSIVLIASIALFFIFPFHTPITLLLISFLPLFYLIIIFSRSVEEIAMQKEIPVSELQEGDMVVEDVMIKGKKIASKRDMDGLSKEALETIKKSKIKKVKIKWGIRFAPAFPLAIAICPFWAGLVMILI
jgi:Flp pilus assembly protein protease CpaA